MSEPSSSADSFGQIADQFVAEFRQGQRPSVEDYAQRHPEHAEAIREILPALVLVEKAKSADDAPVRGAQQGTNPTAGPGALRELGDYRILREIGHGGMGIVYEAEQVSLGRHVALKVLPPQLLGNPKYRRRFEREAKAAAKLHHTNIVPVYGVGEHDGLPYYAMQFIQGLGLDAVLDELIRTQEGRAQPDEEPREARQEISASALARSLRTGAFEPAPHDDSDVVPKAPGEGNVEEIPDAFSENPPVAPPAKGWLSDSFQLLGHFIRLAHHVASPATGWLSDSSARSSSSVVLPGQSGDARQSKAKKPTYWQSVATLGVQVADALEYAHKQGVQHRDIKPSNLLLDPQGVVWITDFGLAKVEDQQNLTQPGDILGTLRYMPPEAFEGKTDSRGDIYSLGLTLYELLAFRPAFGEKDRHKLIKQVTSTEPASLGQLNPEVPRDLETIVHKAIAREPGHRYQRASELAADLQRFLDDEPIQARPLSPGERLARWCRRNPMVASLVAAVMLVTVVGFVGVLAQWRVAMANAEQAQAKER